MPDKGPAIGEVRTYQDETRMWDGSEWKLVPRTFLGTEDFTGRMREYAKPLVKTMAKDITAPILHPIDTVTGLAHMLANPEDLINSTKAIGKSVIAGEPEGVGHVLSAVAAPKVYDAALSGTNSAAKALASDARVRNGAGYAGGALASLLSGTGHPFIGGMIGRTAAPLLKYPAEEVANATDWLKNKIHGTPDAATVVPDALKEQYAALVKQYGSGVADGWLKRQTGGETSAAPAPIKPVSKSIQDLVAGKGKEPSPAPAQAPTAAPTEPTPPSNGQPSERRMAELMDKFGGQQGKLDTSKAATDKALADEITRLRRTYGADRIGAQTNPEAPDAGVGAVLKAAPGPSAMPDIAQQALLRDLKAGTTADPSKTLRALSQLLKEYKRNSGAAKSPIAQELADMLKKHGFDTGEMP